MVQKLIDEMIKNYQKNKHLPSDKEITRLSIEWYQRDWSIPSMEGMGFQRGVDAGMRLMRNIIEFEKIEQK